MAKRIKFAIAALLLLLDHTEKAPAQSPMLQDLVDPKMWKEGAKPDKSGFVKSEDVKAELIKPRLILVKDSGIYLMSNGSPPLLEDEQPPEGIRHKVLYAEGYGPDASYDELVAVAGGDDFGEGIDASEICGMLVKAPNANYFYVEIRKTTFAFGVA